MSILRITNGRWEGITADRHLSNWQTSDKQVTPGL